MCFSLLPSNICVRRVIHLLFVRFFFLFTSCPFQLFCLNIYVSSGFFFAGFFPSFVFFFLFRFFLQAIQKIYNRYANVRTQDIFLSSSKIIGNAHVVVTNFVGCHYFLRRFFLGSQNDSLRSFQGRKNIESLRIFFACEALLSLLIYLDHSMTVFSSFNDCHDFAYVLDIYFGIIYLRINRIFVAISITI